MNENKIQLFEDKRIRTAWDEEREEWLFSIVDVIGVLTDNDYQAARNYWKVLKSRLLKEGNQTVTNCNRLKMTAYDGKQRLTDVADTQQLLRVIQSIPSPKAEPFKMWLASVGRDRIQETIDPELTLDRALETYLKKGYSRDWKVFKSRLLKEGNQTVTNCNQLKTCVGWTRPNSGNYRPCRG